MSIWDGIVEFVTDVWDWVVNGPHLYTVLAHHPDDQDARALLLNIRRDLDAPTRILEASNISGINHDESRDEFELGVGTVAILHQHRPGWRSFLWGAEQIHISIMRLQKEA